MTAATSKPPREAFTRSRQRFEGLVQWLDGCEAAGMDHAQLEAQLDREGRELQRRMLQDHLDVRALREQRVTVVDADDVGHSAVETSHQRGLATIFGDVTVTRMAYRHRGHPNLHPADAALNLPARRHSHGLRRLAAVEASRGSFDDAVAAIARSCGQTLGKRQIEDLTRRAAVDFDDFYATRPRPSADPDDALVISCDGKGIVMLPDALRPATAKAAAAATTKLTARLSKGEKRGRKRMATVGAVYDITPLPRRPTDILTSHDQPRAPAPLTHGKWLTASVRHDPATVITQLFDEAQRRDPNHTRAWVVLVDGNNHQIDLIRAQARSRRVLVSIVIDFIHVLEYIWAAAWSFYNEGDPAAQTWVGDKATAVLRGEATRVAAAIRRKATWHQLDPPRRHNADRCADYLRNKARYLGYPIALAMGWPIATGVIEGACRHLIKDRLDITGARWGIDGAEAVLKLRALRSNGDLDAYWHYHLNREHQRVHQARYANNLIPQAA
jgi:hypothetical protein